MTWRVMHARSYFKVIIATLSTSGVATADKSKVPPDSNGVGGPPFIVSGPTYIGQGHYEFFYTPERRCRLTV